jgi:2-C-methyl-D-erythritol 2,4-cyclodiphosphate synthase
MSGKGAVRFRIGQGFDSHRLEPGRSLVLGGVDIPYDKGLSGHSDADALAHAVADAILGALALGDLGQHFPDTDPAYKDADSMAILAKVYEMMHEQGYRVVNLDCTIIAEAPKLAPYFDDMKRNLSRVLSVEDTSVSIKGKTAEGMGAIGRGEGIAAAAVVLLEKQ